MFSKYQISWRSSFIAYLRGLRLFSRTTPELDSLDLWLVHRRLYFVGIVLSAPVVLFIYVLRPLVLLRFVVFQQSERIGAFVPSIAYFSLVSSRSTKRFRTTDFVSISSRGANSQCVVMLKRQVRIMPLPWLWLFLERACHFWTRSEVHRVSVTPELKQFPQLSGNSGVLVFNATDQNRGNLYSRLSVYRWALLGYVFIIVIPRILTNLYRLPDL